LRKYSHLERVGHRNTRDIELGKVHIFPKIDGTNVRACITDGELQCGSRNRVLPRDDDHFGFVEWSYRDDIREHLMKVINDLGGESRGIIVYGEWLVKHTLGTYRDDAWRKLYVFDVYSTGDERYLSYDEYCNYFDELHDEIQLVRPLAIATNPTEDQLGVQLEANTYLIKDGEGTGEGIVLKNYGWTNYDGKQVWAKIVKNEFREKNKAAFGTPKIGEAFQVESAIALEYVTKTLVLKEQAKLQGIERHILIPRLLGTVFHCVIQEELWTALKKHKMPTIDFKALRRYCEFKTKEHAEDLF